MKERISKLFTKKVLVKSGQKTKRVEIPPSQTLIYGVITATAALVLLTVLETAHMAFIGKFNAEIFSTITLVVGTLLGTFFGQRA
ncbi:MAG: hypothetical protein CW691_07430 [Candidatus Bathyarchaeum sp.]|nr:MAG: hypothetical protein CW691_07430 [Candidatus Bathyarchaeum sp.]